MPSLNHPIVEPLLTQALLALKPEGFIAEQIFPFVGVNKYSGKLGSLGNDFLRIENSHKSARGKYRMVDAITRSTQAFSIEGHGLEDMVTKQDYANDDLPYNVERDKSMALAMHLQIEKEKLVADTLSDTAVLTQNTTLAGGDQYSDYSNSTPVEDFQEYQEAIRAGSGVYADTLILDASVYRKVRFHPQLLDALGFKWDRPGGLKPDELASALDLRRVIIASGVYNSAKEGQSDVIAPIWGKHMILAALPDSAQPYQISLGYRIGLQGSQPRKMYKYPATNPPGANMLLCEDEYDYLIAKASAAYLVKNAIA